MVSSGAVYVYVYVYAYVYVYVCDNISLNHNYP